jgi:IS30 family transposase
MKPEPTIEQSLRTFVEGLVRVEVRVAIADALRVDEFLSPKHAAKFADVHPQTIHKWLRTQRLTRFGVDGEKQSGKRNQSRVVRVSRLELERLIRTGMASDLSPEQLIDQDKRFG